MRVVVTGGGGSIGSELVKMFCKTGNEVLAFDRNPSALTQFDQRRKIETMYGTTLNESDLAEGLMDADIVVHTAAMKHVPYAEERPWKTCRHNVRGTMNVVQEAAHRDVRMINISTDKAAAPTGVMGATKRIAEQVVTNAETSACNVRLGNVVDSQGSFLQVFHDHGQRGCDLPVTDPEMTRFITPQPKVRKFVSKAVGEDERTDTIVPKSSSVRVGTVAELISDQYEVGINKIGHRPGEKKHELLIDREESRRAIERDDCYIIGEHNGNVEPIASDERVLSRDDTRELVLTS